MDATHIPELVNQNGYPVLFQAYEAVPSVRQLIADVRPVDPASIYGTKSTTIIGGSEMAEREDGAGVERDRMEKGYVWQVKVRGYGKELFLPNELIEASSSTEIGNIVTEWAATVGQQAAYQKEKLIADLLQKGTLAAGSELFDGSFPGNPDANPTKIYDGQPFFSAAHPLIVGSDTLSNLTTGNALTSTTLTSAKVLMMQDSALDDRGNRIMNMPGAIIVAPSMEATARVVLNSQLLPGSANNDINPNAGSLQVIVNPFLTDTASAAAWWLKSMNVPGIRMYDSGAPELKVYDSPERNGTVVQLLGRWGANVIEWRGLQANNKATS